MVELHCPECTHRQDVLDGKFFTLVRCRTCGETPLYGEWVDHTMSLMDQVENLDKKVENNDVKSISFNTDKLINSKKNNSLRGDKMVDFNEIERFEAPKFTLEGEKVTISDVMNKEIAVLDIHVQASAYFAGDFAGIQILNEKNEKQYFNCSSGVVIKQLSDLKEKGLLPKRVTIRKIKRYYSIS